MALDPVVTKSGDGDGVEVTPEWAVVEARGHCCSARPLGLSGLLPLLEMQFVTSVPQFPQLWKEMIQGDEKP